MQSHLKLVSIVYGALGALGVGLAFVVLLFFGGARFLYLDLTDPSGAFHQGASAVEVWQRMSLTSRAAVSILLPSVPSLVIGIGLLKRRAWARALTIVIAIVTLLASIIGLVLGAYGLVVAALFSAYTLWVLLTARTKALFAA